MTGNKALHGYEIAADGDNAASFDSLVELIDFVVKDQITKPKEIAALFQKLPDAEHAKIQKRDNGKGN
ncbi:hypothetical protein J2D73_19240 [Acetobacter sacchari]|uniref:Uncharacterized protein n=1 Tax=Acetobacter sacchari TaxID=2661687 RepID=A0ABS3M1F2_9PROT|nr:hypothetical protein [Acetobacter sacchari]MBO1361921.1 hypothetical protein [Acetobacter sacchari]